MKLESIKRCLFILGLTLVPLSIWGQNTTVYVDSLLRVARQKPVDKAVINAYIDLFHHYEYSVYQDKIARTYLDTTQTLLELYPNEESQVRYNRIMGSYLTMSANFELGIAYFQKNIAYYESKGDELKAAVAKFKMANHLQDLGESLGGHAASSRIDKEVLPIFIKYKDNFHYCGVLGEELFNYPKGGGRVAFRNQAQSCIAELTKYKDWNNLMYAYFAMLERYHTEGYYTDDEADDLLQKIKEAATNDDPTNNELFLKYWQPAVYLHQKKYDLALTSAYEYLTEAQKIPTQINETRDMFDVISKAYQAKGNMTKAIAYKDSLLIYSDKIATNRHENAAFALELQYRSEQTHKALQVSKTRQYWLIGSLGLLGLLAGFVYFQSRLKTIANNRLSKSYEKIEQQKTQLQLLFQELHHRVKNNLQLISSLMSIQAARVDDDKTKMVLAEGQQRVESISMIHQRLYQSEDISEMDFKTYINDLVEKIMRAYHYNHHTLKCDVVVEVTTLTPDEYIPLGLIINELLTNSFKYAFPKAEHPTLTLHFKTLENQKYRLEYADNGKGLSDTDVAKTTSFGLTLIKMLSQQLGGQYQFQNKNGLWFELLF